jgi:hypothetical protein
MQGLHQRGVPVHLVMPVGVEEAVRWPLLGQMNGLGRRGHSSALLNCLSDVLARQVCNRGYQHIGCHILNEKLVEALISQTMMNPQMNGGPWQGR